MRLHVVGQEELDFAEFYQISRDACLKAVVASVGNRQLAEDLVAESFAKAWVSWPKVSRHPAPRAWVVRTALNTGVSWWRKRRRETALTVRYDVAAPTDVNDGVDDILIAVLRSLPQRQREVIALRLFLDLDTATTASVLGVAEGTVMAHLSRAITTLREQLLARDAAQIEQSSKIRRLSNE